MTDVPTVIWTGASGKKYTYYVYKLPPNFVAKPGNYIFAKTNSQNQWEAAYIGETENLSERFDNHHAMPCINRNGATHIQAHVTNGGKQARLNEETDLVRNYNPTCNK